MKNKPYIPPLILKYLEGSLDPSELEFFRFRLMDDPEFAREVHLYKKAFYTVRGYRQIQLKASLRQFEKAKKGRSIIVFRMAKTAAVLLVFLSFALYLQFGGTIKKSDTKAYAETPGQLDRVEEKLPEQPVIAFIEKEEVTSDPSALVPKPSLQNASSEASAIVEDLPVRTPPAGRAPHVAAAGLNTIENEDVVYPVSVKTPDPLTIPAIAARITPFGEGEAPFRLSSNMATRTLLKGRISDQMTNTGLPATVLVDKKGINTDARGNFQLEIQPGDYTVIAKMLGYEDARRRIQAGPGKVLNLNLLMAASVTQLQTLTITASKFEKPLGELTTSAEIISGEMVQEKSLNSIDDFLEKITGVNVIDGQVTIRGGSGFSYGAGSRVLLLLDGLPALQGDAAFPDWDLIPIENTEKLEVIKGASSALYGSSSLNGVIDVRTGFPGDEAMTKASVFTSAYLTPKDKEKKWWGKDSDAPSPYAVGLSFLHGKKVGPLDLIGAIYAYKDQSFREGGYAEYIRTHLKSRYHISEQMHAGINANIQAGNSAKSFVWKNFEEGAFQSLAGTITENSSLRVMVDPFFTYRDTSGNQHKLLSRYYYWNNEQANASSDQSNQSHQVFGEYQFQRHFDETDLTITAGVNGSHTRSMSELFGDTLHTASNAGTYFNVDQRFFDRLNLSFGARLETNRFSGERPEKLQLEPVFRIGANYRVTDQTYVRASWGQGYRAPTIAEKFITTSISALRVYPNPDLRPERGWSGEVGIKQGFNTPHFNGFFDVSSFWMEYNDMMEFTFRQWGTFTDPLWGFGFAAKNVGNTRIRGVELGVTGEGEIGPVDVTLNMGYTYVDPKYKDYHPDTVRSSADYNVLKYRFRHTVKMDMEFRYKKWSAGLGGQYHSFMEAIDEFFVNEQLLTVANLQELGIGAYRENNSKGNFVVDAWLTFEPVQQLNLSLIGRNVLNTEYSMRPAILEAPANLTMRLSYRI